MVLGCRNRLMMLLRMTVAFSAALVLSGCIQENSQQGNQAGKGQLPDVAATDKAPTEDSVLAEGARLFAELCVSCHGAAGNGRGSRGGPSLQRPEFTYGRTSAAITQSIRDGRPGGMPAFGHVFTPRQLEALSRYIQSLKK